MLKQRVITALILLPIVVAAIAWLPNLYFAIFFGVFACIGGWEWTRFLCASQETRASMLRGVYVGIVALLLIASWVFVVGNSQFQVAVLSTAVFWWIMAIAFILIYPDGSKFRKSIVISSLVGMVILVSTWVSIVVLRNNYAAGTELLLYLIILIAVADSGAYFGGRRWGKHKLAPKVSPGKSWEGVISGLVCVSLLAFGYSYLLGLQFEGWPNIFLFMGISLVTAVFSIVGDLTESMYKREAGVKDSGTIFPGHGGVLDRIDSLTAAAPVFLVSISWFYLG